jgi:hypothetical protein
MIRFAAFAALTATLLVLSAMPNARADSSDPAGCAALAFRAVGPGLADGEQDSGFYKSHLGKIEVLALIKSGAAQNYFLQMNGKALAPVPGGLPDDIAACAKAKRLAPPSSPDSVCTGDRLVVLIGHDAERHYVLLYAHRGNVWHFCSAGIA